MIENTNTQQQQQTVETQIAALQSSEAYNQRNHPEHDAAVDQMLALHQAKLDGETARRSNADRIDPGAPIMADPDAARPSALDAVLPDALPADVARDWKLVAVDVNIGANELAALAAEALKHRDTGSGTKEWTEKETMQALAAKHGIANAESMVALAVEYLENEIPASGRDAAKRFLAQRKAAGPALVETLASRMVERQELKNTLADLREQLRDAPVQDRRRLTDRIIAIQGILY